MWVRHLARMLLEVSLGRCAPGGLPGEVFSWRPPWEVFSWEAFLGRCAPGRRHGLDC